MKTSKKSRKEGIHPRKPPTQVRAEKRVDAILAAYMRLLAGDIRLINTNRLAKEAGIPISSIYQYFPHRESITFAVYKCWVEGVIKDLLELKQAAKNVTHWTEYYEINKNYFYSRSKDAKFDYSLVLVMDSTPELKEVQSEYQEKMFDIISETLQSLGTDWPKSALKNTVAMSLELNLATLRYMVKRPTSGVEDIHLLWETMTYAWMKLVIETPYEKVKIGSNGFPRRSNGSGVRSLVRAPFQAS